MFLGGCDSFTRKTKIGYGERVKKNRQIDSQIKQKCKHRLNTLTRWFFREIPWTLHANCRVKLANYTIYTRKKLDSCNDFNDLQTKRVYIDIRYM